MGMEQRIHSKQPITWPSLSALFREKQFPVEMRMIDGQLAFPDEEPPETWQELRISTPPGMITLKRDGDILLTVIWGNADPEMLQAWNAVTWACAKVSDGEVETQDGNKSASEYLQSAEFPDGFS